ncbi:MAG: phage tail protein, partial [Desulfovibrionaceae bacterium]
MSAYKTYLTTVGKEVMARAAAGEQFQIVAIALGDGVWSEEQQASYGLTDLVNERVRVEVASSVRAGESYKVTAVLNNTGLTEGFMARELGVIAYNEAMGNVLFMAGFVGDQYTYVVDESTAPVSYPIPLTIVVGNSGNITVSVADNVYATKDDLDGHDEDADVHGPLVDALAVATPVLTAPASGATDVIETPTLRSSAFSTRFSDVTHAATQFQVDLATGDFSSPVHDTGALGAVTQYVLPLGVQSVSTAYKGRVRHRDASGLWSEWSDPVSWTTRAEFVYIVPPSIITPSDGATGVGETPVIQTTAFAVHGGGTDTHIGTEYQIKNAAADWSSLIYDSGEVLALLTLLLGAGILQVSTVLNIRARHRGTTYGWSEWSDEITITTAAAFIVGDEAATWEASADAWPYEGLLSNAAYNASAPVEQDADEGDYAAATPRVVDPSPLALALDAATTAAVLRWTGRTLAEDAAVLVGLADGSLHARALGAVSAYSQINAVTNDVDGGENNNTYG